MPANTTSTADTTMMAPHFESFITTEVLLRSVYTSLTTFLLQDTTTTTPPPVSSSSLSSKIPRGYLDPLVGTIMPSPSILLPEGAIFDTQSAILLHNHLLNVSSSSSSDISTHFEDFSNIITPHVSLRRDIFEFVSQQIQHIASHPSPRGAGLTIENLQTMVSVELERIIVNFTKTIPQMMQALTTAYPTSSTSSSSISTPTTETKNNNNKSPSSSTNHPPSAVITTTIDNIEGEDVRRRLLCVSVSELLLKELSIPATSPYHRTTTIRILFNSSIVHSFLEVQAFIVHQQQSNLIFHRNSGSNNNTMMSSPSIDEHTGFFTLHKSNPTSITGGLAGTTEVNNDAKHAEEGERANVALQVQEQGHRLQIMAESLIAMRAMLLFISTTTLQLPHHHLLSAVGTTLAPLPLIPNETIVCLQKVPALSSYGGIHDADRMMMEYTAASSPEPIRDHHTPSRRSHSKNGTASKKRSGSRDGSDTYVAPGNARSPTRAPSMTGDSSDTQKLPHLGLQELGITSLHGGCGATTTSSSNEYGSHIVPLAPLPTPGALTSSNNISPTSIRRRRTENNNSSSIGGAGNKTGKGDVSRSQNEVNTNTTTTSHRAPLSPHRSRRSPSPVVASQYRRKFFITAVVERVAISTSPTRNQHSGGGGGSRHHNHPSSSLPFLDQYLKGALPITPSTMALLQQHSTSSDATTTTQSTITTITSISALISDICQGNKDDGADTATVDEYLLNIEVAAAHALSTIPRPPTAPHMHAIGQASDPSYLALRLYRGLQRNVLRQMTFENDNNTAVQGGDISPIVADSSAAAVVTSSTMHPPSPILAGDDDDETIEEVTTPHQPDSQQQQVVDDDEDNVMVADRRESFIEVEKMVQKEEEDCVTPPHLVVALNNISIDNGSDMGAIITTSNSNHQNHNCPQDTATYEEEGNNDSIDEENDDDDDPSSYYDKLREKYEASKKLITLNTSTTTNNTTTTNNLNKPLKPSISKAIYQRKFFSKPMDGTFVSQRTHNKDVAVEAHVLQRPKKFHVKELEDAGFIPSLPTQENPQNDQQGPMQHHDDGFDGDDDGGSSSSTPAGVRLSLHSSTKPVKPQWLPRPPHCQVYQVNRSHPCDINATTLKLESVSLQTLKEKDKTRVARHEANIKHNGAQITARITNGLYIPRKPEDIVSDTIAARSNNPQQHVASSTSTSNNNGGGDSIDNSSSWRNLLYPHTHESQAPLSDQEERRRNLAHMLIKKRDLLCNALIDQEAVIPFTQEEEFIEREKYAKHLGMTQEQQSVVTGSKMAVELFLGDETYWRDLKYSKDSEALLERHRKWRSGTKGGQLIAQMNKTAGVATPAVAPGGRFGASAAALTKPDDKDENQLFDRWKVFTVASGSGGAIGVEGSELPVSELKKRMHVEEHAKRAERLGKETDLRRRLGNSVDVGLLLGDYEATTPTSPRIQCNSSKSKEPVATTTTTTTLAHYMLGGGGRTRTGTANNNQQPNDVPPQTADTTTTSNMARFTPMAPPQSTYHGSAQTPVSAPSRVPHWLKPENAPMPEEHDHHTSSQQQLHSSRATHSTTTASLFIPKGGRPSSASGTHYNRPPTPPAHLAPFDSLAPLPTTAISGRELGQSVRPYHNTKPVDWSPTDVASAGNVFRSARSKQHANTTSRDHSAQNKIASAARGKGLNNNNSAHLGGGDVIENNKKISQMKRRVFAKNYNQVLNASAPDFTQQRAKNQLDKEITAEALSYT